MLIRNFIKLKKNKHVLKIKLLKQNYPIYKQFLKISQCKYVIYTFKKNYKISYHTK